MERGYHLTLDAMSCKNARALADLSFIYDLLDAMPEKVGMQAITPPILRRWLAPPDPESGLSGMIMISTSHISIHTFPEKNKFYFDIFSCKEFDVHKVLKMLHELFLFDRDGSRINLLERS